MPNVKILLALSITVLLLSGCDGCTGCDGTRNLTLNAPDSLTEMRAAEIRRQYQESLERTVQKPEKKDSAYAQKNPEKPSPLFKPKDASGPSEKSSSETVYIESGIDYNAMEETIINLEDKVKTTIEAAKRRLGNRSGYVQYQFTVGFNGQVKSVTFFHNDLDEFAKTSIEAIIKTTQFSRWTPKVNSENEYKSPMLKSVF